jgi:hypothetical protein
MRRKQKMKNRNIQKYWLYSSLGFIILAIGAVLAKVTRNTEGIMQTLPYIFIGIGAGIFGQNLGTAFSILAAKKDPKLAKEMEINEKDERIITIRNMAKAKAYDIMIMAFGALMMAFALMNVNWIVVLSFVAVYLFVIFSNIYFISKYSKEL